MDKKTLRLPARTDRLPEVLAFLEQRLEQMDCPPKAQMQINVAAEEIFVNIASYAYAPGTGEAEVCVDEDEAPGYVTITMTDCGTPFDPLAKEDPDTELPAQERGIGGLGIFMTKKLMDEVSYEYKDGRNILKMKKRL